MAASNTSYIGPQNTGSATVLEREAPSLFTIMDQLDAKKAANVEAKRVEAAARGKQLNEMLEYSPEAVWQDYDSEVTEEYNKEYLDYVKNVFSEGGTPTTDQLIEIQRRKNNIDANVNFYNGYKTSVDDARTRITTGEEAKFYNQDYFEEHLGTISYDEKGNKRKKEELTPQALNSMWDQRGLYNSDEIMKSFVGNLGKNTWDAFKNEPYGQSVTTNEMSALYDIDPATGEPPVDDDGNYIYKVGEASFKAAMGDANTKRLIEWERQDMIEESGQDVSNYEAFQRLSEKHASSKSTIKTKYDPRLNTWARESIGNTEEKERGILRKEMIAELQAGNPEMLGLLIGAKSGKRYITDTNYDPVNGITVTYDDSKSEVIPIKDFNRFNDLISTQPNQEKVSHEVLAEIPEAKKVPLYQDIDTEALNSDISVIQSGEGTDMLSILDGVSDVKYVKGGAFSEGGFYTFKDGSREIKIDVTKENNGGYKELKKLLLKKTKDDNTYIKKSGGNNNSNTTQKGKVR